MHLFLTSASHEDVLSGQGLGSLSFHRLPPQWEEALGSFYCLSEIHRVGQTVIFWGSEKSRNMRVNTFYKGGLHFQIIYSNDIFQSPEHFPGKIPVNVKQQVQSIYSEKVQQIRYISRPFGHSVVFRSIRKSQQKSQLIMITCYISNV